MPLRGRSPQGTGRETRNAALSVTSRQRFMGRLVSLFTPWDVRVCVKTRGRARARRDELEGLRLTLEGSVAGLAAYVEQAMCARQHHEIAVRLNSPLFTERLFIHTHGHENEDPSSRGLRLCVTCK